MMKSNRARSAYEPNYTGRITTGRILHNKQDSTLAEKLPEKINK
jgi:hypothetical protein